MPEHLGWINSSRVPTEEARLPIGYSAAASGTTHIISTTTTTPSPQRDPAWLAAMTSSLTLCTQTEDHVAFHHTRILTMAWTSRVTNDPSTASLPQQLQLSHQQHQVFGVTAGGETRINKHLLRQDEVSTPTPPPRLSTSLEKIGHSFDADKALQRKAVASLIEATPTTTTKHPTVAMLAQNAN